MVAVGLRVSRVRSPAFGEAIKALQGRSCRVPLHARWQMDEPGANCCLHVGGNHPAGEGKEPTFLHSGGHNWNQSDAAGGPIDEARGTSFALTGDGIAWFASYDGLSAGTNPEATAALDREFGKAREHISSLPDTDGFAALGIYALLLMQ